LNFAFFIGKRLAFKKQQSFSRFIIRLSIAATAVSVAAMIITLAFVNGFQKTVSEKVFSFWGHIRVQHFEASKALVSEEMAIAKNDTVLALLKQQPAVAQVQVFATKSVILEKSNTIEGNLFKGIDVDYDSAQLKPYLVQGRWLRFEDSLYSREIILSEPIARELKLKLNDTMNVHFISPREGTAVYRPVKVVGLYKTGIDEYDNHFAIGDIRLIRRLADWKPNEIGGYEVFLKDYHIMDSVNQQLDLPTVWVSKTVREVYPNIFDWLNIQDVNRNVVFAVMGIVAIINLITCLLILVLERTRMVGLLKALGANNTSIQQVFLYHAAWITLVGVGIGLALGVGLCLLQQLTGFIRLDEATYYVSKAPVFIIWWQIGLVCLLTAIVCFISLLLPTLIIRSIKPVKAIAFR
jgi:lipoprotein-releasing system permease protein